ncbi:MAG: winged helix-turn-helix domain-containing protein [Rhodobacteraceae bacterium]|nr:winged helix-turn-helix domain-containing protein [Paracoccaceae bacterium]
MIYEFDGFELDLNAVELRSRGHAVPLQPQVFDLLFLLVENHDRMVSRDEIVEKIWQGRAISETAISSRIKALRQALGDDGAEQRIIRTVHGRGFRIVAEVTLKLPVTVEERPREMRGAAGGPPSIAVLPFRNPGQPTPDLTGDAIAHDIIVSLSRLRWLRVIARGSSFRFRDPDPDLRTIGHALGVRYCLTGDVEHSSTGIDVHAELDDTTNDAVVWSERFRIGPDEIGGLRDVICRHVAAALEFHIPEAEASKVKALPGPLHDSWSRFHLGLHHLFRLNREDNTRAVGHFEAALALEPEFVRAWAGLSFTDFQSAYLGYDKDPGPRIAAARNRSQHALSIDSNDAFSHLTMGRSYWLDGQVAESLPWLEGATELSPNYAQAHYSQAWAAAMLGRSKVAHASVELAMALSPLDPFLYAMRGTKALAYLTEDAPQEAVPWIELAAGTPGAHPVVGLVAAACRGLSGEPDAACTWVARMRERNPGVSCAYFFRSIPFSDPGLRDRLGHALRVAGLQ